MLHVVCNMPTQTYNYRMKYLILLVTTLFITNFGYSQIDNCKEFKTGVFQFSGINGGVYTIIRNDTTQFERSSKRAQHSIMKIKWESGCQYTLYDRTEYKWGKEPRKDTVFKEIRNIVYKFEKPNKYYVKTSIPGFSDTVETIFRKLDTTKHYNNLFQLKEFAEYKNSKAYGQTLLGETHSIDYYQSNKDSNKYLITFETTYHGEKLNKTRLIDSVIINIKDNERITNSNCRINGEFDDEILAIYSSKNQEQEATIIKAYRCNRETEAIEEIDTNTIQYKESDRNRIKW